VTLKGENFEASGVLDPTFWLIHPTTDRLFQASALAHDRIAAAAAAAAATAAAAAAAAASSLQQQSRRRIGDANQMQQQAPSLSSSTSNAPVRRALTTTTTSSSSSTATTTTGHLLNISKVVDEIWPTGNDNNNHAVALCGSLADCLTCNMIDSWLLRALRAAGITEAVGGCINPSIGPEQTTHQGIILSEVGRSGGGGGGADAAKMSSSSKKTKTNLEALIQGPETCCYGHNRDDRLFTQ
jgi:hypothetical protein